MADIPPAASSGEPIVHIVVEDMFDGDAGQFEDTFGGEPGGLTLAGFVHLAASHGQPVRIEITPAQSGH